MSLNILMSSLHQGDYLLLIEFISRENNFTNKKVVERHISYFHEGSL